MKNLEEFRLIHDFLLVQGIQPTVAMVAMSQKAWSELVIIAQEWKGEMEEAAQAQEDARAAMLPEEMEMAERQEKARLQLEKERLLFHSTGYRPGVRDVRD